MADPQHIGVRFEEAIDFLRRRLAVPPERWLTLVREVDAAARDRAAGMSDALVRDIQKAVLEALEQGTGYREFVENFEESARRHGWADEDGDPSGGRSTELAWRVSIAQAQAAGRWQQIQRLKHVRPYLRYVHVDPHLTQLWSREEHAAWHNVVLPVDHLWWLTHFPPNGWRCRCGAQSPSERDLARYGLKVSESAPIQGNVIRMIRGRPVETPWGIDPGFGFNPGVVGLRLPRPHVTQDGSLG